MGVAITDTRQINIAPRLSGEQLRQYAQRQVDGKVTLRAFFPGATVRDAELNQATTNGGGADADITAVINTDTVDSYMTIVDPKGGDFTNYLRNPILLWQHGMDYGIGSWPVGNVRTIDAEDTQVTVSLAFDTADDLGAALDRKYRDKVLRGFSIGFIPRAFAQEKIDGVEIIRYTDWELRELSAVSVPSNPDALARSLAAGGEGDITEPRLRAALLRTLPPLAAPAKKTGDAKLTDNRTQQPPVNNPAKQTVEVRTADGSVIKLEVDADTAAQVRSSSLVAPVADPNQQVFDRNWDNAAEQASMATREDAERMAAVILEDGDGLRALYVHHHHDGRLNFKALAVGMARLLTDADELEGEERDAAYDHLAAHYRELGVEPPEAGCMDEDRAYELALEGRLAHLDDDGNAWMFAEAVASEEGDEEGRMLAGFVAIDSDEIKLCVPPEFGPHTEHKHWGLRKPVQVDQTVRLLKTIAQQNRTIAELRSQMTFRAGSKFSKANRTKIAKAADGMETHVRAMAGHCRDMQTKCRDSLAVVDNLRDMIAEDDGDADDDESAIKGKKGASGLAERVVSGLEADDPFGEIEIDSQEVREIVTQTIQGMTAR